MRLFLSRLAGGANALKSDRRGVTALEYGLISALIAVVIIGGVTTIGGKLVTTFATIGAALPAAK